MEVCCSVCQITGRPSEYDVYQQSEEECPLTRDQSTNCRPTNCIWKFRIITMCLTISSFVMIGYLIYLQSLLGSSARIAVDHGAVATDNAHCSMIGTAALEDGGNAVDAAIAAVLCMTVIAPYKTGLGGGGIAMVYNSADQSDPLVIDFASNTIAGPLADAKVRIPAVIRGLEFLHGLKGSVSWSRVVEPAAKLAREGFVITRYFAEEISKVPDYSRVFGYLKPGEILEIPHLGHTLEAIKNHGAQVLYNGSFTIKFLRDEVDLIHDDLRSQLANYKPIKTKGKKSDFYNHIIYTQKHSELFQSILEKIESLNIPVDETTSFESQLKVARTLIETINEDDNLKEESYTAVIAADSKHNLVSIVTGLSAPLGQGHMTGAGFLLDKVTTSNDLHFLTPVIFQSKKNPRKYSGAFGVDDPILGAEILSNLILQHMNLSTAIETQRYYRLPDGILLEPSAQFPLNQALTPELSNFHQSPSHISTYSKSVNGILKEQESLSSHSDSRGGGVASRYK